ncbi:hypothetical protein B0H16DRAFT_1904079 [Mycena metata]|uniref:Uncharacterized protein n=1 Tax=Mycena metata TaxID=1033252 RepID=A0AAD7GHP8_9AGAR|nr:hypothetical protein B0H16DRAFT_1904079 [Mycena metata]
MGTICSDTSRPPSPHHVAFPNDHHHRRTSLDRIQPHLSVNGTHPPLPTAAQHTAPGPPRPQPPFPHTATHLPFARPTASPIRGNGTYLAPTTAPLRSPAPHRPVPTTPRAQLRSNAATHLLIPPFPAPTRLSTHPPAVLSPLPHPPLLSSPWPFSPATLGTHRQPAFPATSARARRPPPSRARRARTHVAPSACRLHPLAPWTEPRRRDVGTCRENSGASLYHTPFPIGLPESPLPPLSPPPQRATSPVRATRH